MKIIIIYYIYYYYKFKYIFIIYYKINIKKNIKIYQFDHHKKIMIKNC